MAFSNEMTMQVIGCLVEALADDDGKIDMKCFEKVCNAGIKAAFESSKIGDQLVGNLREALKEVCCIVEISIRQNQDTSLLMCAVEMGAQ